MDEKCGVERVEEEDVHQIRHRCARPVEHGDTPVRSARPDPRHGCGCGFKWTGDQVTSAEARQLPRFHDHVGPGWRQILEDLHRDLLNVDPGYQVFQVKEKFGDLRVYLDPSLSGLGDSQLTRTAVAILVSKAADKSRVTCEVCGEPGILRPGGWVKTLCDTCHEQRKHVGLA